MTTIDNNNSSNDNSNRDNIDTTKESAGNKIESRLKEKTEKMKYN